MRIDKISALVKKNIAEIIRKDVRHPDLGFVTITRVKITKDLSIARVFFTVLNLSQENTQLAKEKSCHALSNSASFIRCKLASQVMLRATPKLFFEYDDALEEAYKITSLIDEEVK